MTLDLTVSESGPQSTEQNLIWKGAGGEAVDDALDELQVLELLFHSRHPSNSV